MDVSVFVVSLEEGGSRSRFTDRGESVGYLSGQGNDKVSEGWLYRLDVKT